jgi:hypothetical protein
MRRLVLRIGIAVVTITALVGLVSGGLAYAMFRHFSPAPPKADFPVPANEIEAQRQDLSHFRKLIALDRSYGPAARKEAEQRIAALESAQTPLDRPHFRVALMKILALADNGHTHLDSPLSRKLPVRVGVFSDGLYVMRATTASSALLGGRVVAIDGTPLDVVMERLEQLRGGTVAWRRLYAAFYIIDQDILFGADIAHDPRRSQWTVATPEGINKSLMLDSAAPRDHEPFVFTKRWVSDEPVQDMGEGWLAERPEQPLPLALREFDSAFRRVRVGNSCAMLIQLKSNNDVGQQSIKDFIAATRSDMRSNQPCAAVLDLRYDDGGDYLKTVGFAKDLPNLVAPGGHIYLLTGPATFSAGITTAAFVKESGGERVTILGEPVGDRLSFFSEGNRGCLPNYPLCVSYQRGKHDYAHACDDWDVCFWLNKVYPVHVTTLEPDETITMSFSEWRQGRDPAFERAAALSRSAPARPVGHVTGRYCCSDG